jgi:hypothetical protein
MEPYNSGFTTGMKIEVKIPVPHAKAFFDWAVVEEVDGDRVSIRLSRDMLPEGVSLRVGQVLECHNSSDRRALAHQAILTGKGFEQQLQLRLIGQMAADERREFFRIDLFLPVRYQPCDSHNSYQLEKEWKQKQQERKNADSILRRKCREEKREYIPYDQSWHRVLPHGVTICGGGLSLVTDRHFQEDQYLQLEILIPSLPRVVEIVARVIFANRNYAAGKEREYYNVGMQFAFIEETDRSAIVNYITSVQTKRIRQMQGLMEEPLYDPEKEPELDVNYGRRKSDLAGEDEQGVKKYNWKGFGLVVLVFLASCVFMLLVQHLMSYTRGSFNEMGKSIEKSFEELKGQGK